MSDNEWVKPEQDAPWRDHDATRQRNPSDAQAGRQYGQESYGQNEHGPHYGQANPSIDQGFSNAQNQYDSAPQAGAGYGQSNPESNQYRYGSPPRPSGQYGQNTYGSTPQGGGHHGQPEYGGNTQYGQSVQPQNMPIAQGYYGAAPQGGGQYGQKPHGFSAQGGYGHDARQAGHNNTWSGGSANTMNQSPGASGQGAVAAFQVKNPDGSLRIGRVGLLAALAAQFFVIIGCLGPWASLWGSSVSGMNGDGIIVALLSLVIVGLGVAHLLGKVSAKFLWGIVAAAAISFVVGLIDYGNITGVASVGRGLVFVVFFSLVSGGAAALAALRD